MTKFCTDRVLPARLHDAIPFVVGQGGRTRAISPIGKLWINGSTLRVRFLGGTLAQQALVRQFAPQWSQYANLKIVFSTDADAEIRVAFDPNDGAWSYIGTDAKGIAVGEPTLNLGWQDQSVILHEFGHALGLAHEHQNPDGGIQWNEPAVLAALGGPPNNWDEATIRHNVFERYAHDQINGTAFDSKSIMLYSFPAAWTLNGFHTDPNNVLSAVDEAFVAGAKMYPGLGTGVVYVELPVYLPKKSTLASIGAVGEEDRFVFRVATAGQYVIETDGSTDVFMKLFGPNVNTLLIAQDDDSGVGSNAKITASLAAGEYYVQIRHYSATGVGKYGIAVAKL